MKSTIAVAWILASLFFGLISIAYSQPIFLGEYPMPYENTILFVSSSIDDSCHTLYFEGITSTVTVPLGSFYEPWGYYFSYNSLVIVQQRAGGEGNFEFNPSGVAVLFWLEGDRSIINVSSGFTIGFSFYYCANDPASVEVYSGEDGTGTLLATIPLVQTPPPTDYDYWYSNWVPIGVSFEDTAKSISFVGVANRVGFDNITFCDSIPHDIECYIEVNASANDSTLCPGDSTILHSEVAGEYPPVVFEWWSNPAGFSSDQQNPNTGPFFDSTWFIVQATDSLGCEDIDSVLINTLEICTETSAYPNPFNPDYENVKFCFELTKAGNVTVKIFDVAQKISRTIINDEIYPAGEEQQIEWNGRNGKGDIVANGTYFYIIESNLGEKAINKVSVLR